MSRAKAEALKREFFNLPAEPLVQIDRHDASTVVNSTLAAIKDMSRPQAADYLGKLTLDKNLPGHDILKRLHRFYASDEPYVSPNDKKPAELLTDSKTGRVLCLDGSRGLGFNRFEQEQIDLILAEIEGLTLEEKIDFLTRRESEICDEPGFNRVSLHCIRLMCQLRAEAKND